MEDDIPSEFIFLTRIVADKANLTIMFKCAQIAHLFLAGMVYVLTATILHEGPAQINTPPTNIVAGQFVDVTAASKIHFSGVASHTEKKYLLETMGSGVAFFDYDNDGLLDIFFVNGAPLINSVSKVTVPGKVTERDWNRLYHQKKDGTFEDVTVKAGLQGIGYGMGVAVGDYDNDGFEDLWWESPIPQQRQRHFYRRN